MIVGGNASDSILTVNVSNASSIFNGVLGGSLTNQNKLGLTLTSTAPANSLTLSGTNTYTGATTISSGSLIVTGKLGGTAVTVNSGGVLGGTGTIGNGANASVTVNNGGKIDLGDSGIGTLAINGTGNALTLNGGSSLTFDYSSSANDKIVVNGKILIGAGTVTINLNAIGGATAFPTNPVQLMTFSAGSTFTGAFALANNGIGNGNRYTLTGASNSAR
jgi:autotransporter-associated beta strand protein